MPAIVWIVLDVWTAPLYFAGYIVLGSVFSEYYLDEPFFENPRRRRELASYGSPRPIHPVEHFVVGTFHVALGAFLLYRIAKFISWRRVLGWHPTFMLWDFYRTMMPYFNPVKMFRLRQASDFYGLWENRGPWTFEFPIVFEPQEISFETHVTHMVRWGVTRQIHLLRPQLQAVHKAAAILDRLGFTDIVAWASLTSGRHCLLSTRRPKLSRQTPDLGSTAFFYVNYQRNSLWRIDTAAAFESWHALDWPEREMKGQLVCDLNNTDGLWSIMPMATIPSSRAIIAKSVQSQGRLLDFPIDVQSLIYDELLSEGHLVLQVKEQPACLEAQYRIRSNCSDLLGLLLARRKLNEDFRAYFDRRLQGQKGVILDLQLGTDLPPVDLLKSRRHLAVLLRTKCSKIAELLRLSFDMVDQLCSVAPLLRSVRIVPTMPAAGQEGRPRMSAMEAHMKHYFDARPHVDIDMRPVMLETIRPAATGRFDDTPAWHAVTPVLRQDWCIILAFRDQDSSPLYDLLLHPEWSRPNPFLPHGLLWIDHPATLCCDYDAAILEEMMPKVGTSVWRVGQYFVDKKRKEKALDEGSHVHPST